MQLSTKILYLASLAAFMRSFGQVIYSPSQATLVEELGITTTLYGLTISIYALSFAISQIFLGPLVDRFEGKRIYLYGMLLFSLGSMGAFLSTGFGALLASRTIQALGIAAATLVGIAIISDLIPKRERGNAMGVYEIFNAAGATVGPIVGAGLALWLGWRFDFLLLAIVGLLLALAASRQLPTLAVQTQKIGLPEMLTVLRTPATAGAIVLGLVMFYALFTVYTLMPLLLTEQLDFSIGGIGFIVSLQPFGAIIGSYLGGRMLDKTRTRKVAIPGAIGAAIAYGVLTYLSTLTNSSTPIIFIAGSVLLCGVMIGYCLPAQLKIMVDYYPTLRGTASGLLIFFRFIGAALAPVVTGYLADRVSITAGFASVVILLAVGAFIGIMTIFEPKTRNSGLDSSSAV